VKVMSLKRRTSLSTFTTRSPARAPRAARVAASTVGSYSTPAFARGVPQRAANT
jgi:hypothetical protein